MSRKEFAQKVYEAAVRAKAKGYPVLPIVATAQACLESGWGKSLLAQKANNLFGIKAGSSWTGKTIELPTREFRNDQWVEETASWRKYDSYDDCLEDYGRILTNLRYAAAAKAAMTGDEEAYAYGLQKGGWATDPDYAQKLLKMVETVRQVLGLPKESGEPILASRLFVDGQPLGEIEKATLVGDKLYVRLKKR